MKIDSGIGKGEKGKDEKERKISLGRRVEDGLLLVVSAKIYDQNVKALIDSGVARGFATPTCVTMCGLRQDSEMYSLNWEMEKSS